MLFSMSYWLLSKIEARHWKAYLEGKLSQSLSKGSLVGLWLLLAWPLQPPGRPPVAAPAS